MTNPAIRSNETYRFELVIADPLLSKNDVVEQTEQVALEVANELGIPASEIRIETEGGFFGAGETTLLLILGKAALAFLAGAAGAVGKKAGEDVYERLIAPKLRAKNLLPRNFRRVETPHARQ